MPYLINHHKLSRILGSIVFIVLICSTPNYCQNQYAVSFSELKIGLEFGNLAFKDAVFLTENTYFDNRLYRQEFDDELQFLVQLVRIREKSDSLIYKGKDLSRIKTNSAMFKTLTDTTIALFYDTAYYVFMPYRYDFDDIFGSEDWSNMFVTKLLRTRKGNCHSCHIYTKCWQMNLALRHIYRSRPTILT